MEVTRWIWIYTPPNYDRSSAKYPVLYLLHGNGEAQNGWVMNSRANIILDHLIADKKAQPMIVVIPQAHALQGADVAAARSACRRDGYVFRRFPQDCCRISSLLSNGIYRAPRMGSSRYRRAIDGWWTGAINRACPHRPVPLCIGLSRGRRRTIRECRSGVQRGPLETRGP